MPDASIECSPQVAAWVLEVNPRTVARWADEGTLRVHRWTDGGQRRFLLSEVEALANERNGGQA